MKSLSLVISAVGPARREVPVSAIAWHPPTHRSGDIFPLIHSLQQTPTTTLLNCQIYIMLAATPSAINSTSLEMLINN